LYVLQPIDFELSYPAEIQRIDRRIPPGQLQRDVLRRSLAPCATKKLTPTGPFGAPRINLRSAQQIPADPVAKNDKTAPMSIATCEIVAMKGNLLSYGNKHKTIIDQSCAEREERFELSCLDMIFIPFRPPLAP
jgi:hypothetical protein